MIAPSQRHTRRIPCPLCGGFDNESGRTRRAEYSTPALLDISHIAGASAQLAHDLAQRARQVHSARTARHAADALEVAVRVHALWASLSLELESGVRR